MKHRSLKGSTLIETGLLIGAIALFSLFAVSTLGDKTTKAFADASSKLTQTPEISDSTPTYSSCQDAMDHGETVNGFYTIDLAGDPQQMQCTFFQSGIYQGGWTLVSAQKTGSAATWLSNSAADHAQDNFPGQSFSLSTASVPDNTHVAFGFSNQDGTFKSFASVFSRPFSYFAPVIKAAQNNTSTLTATTTIEGVGQGIMARGNTKLSYCMTYTHNGYYLSDNSSSLFAIRRNDGTYWRVNWAYNIRRDQGYCSPETKGYWSIWVK